MFNTNEVRGCHSMQLKWEIEDLLINIPIVGRIFAQSGYSFCKLFEQVKLEGAHE